MTQNITKQEILHDVIKLLHTQKSPADRVYMDIGAVIHRFKQKFSQSDENDVQYFKIMSTFHSESYTHVIILQNKIHELQHVNNSSEISLIADQTKELLKNDVMTKLYYQDIPDSKDNNILIFCPLLLISNMYGVNLIGHFVLVCFAKYGQETIVLYNDSLKTLPMKDVVEKLNIINETSDSEIVHNKLQKFDLSVQTQNYINPQNYQDNISLADDIDKEWFVKEMNDHIQHMCGPIVNKTFEIVASQFSELCRKGSFIQNSAAQYDKYLKDVQKVFFISDNVMNFLTQKNIQPGDIKQIDNDYLITDNRSYFIKSVNLLDQQEQIVNLSKELIFVKENIDNSEHVIPIDNQDLIFYLHNVYGTTCANYLIPNIQNALIDSFQGDQLFDTMIGLLYDQSSITDSCLNEV